MSCNQFKDGPAPGKGKVGTNGGPRHWTNYFKWPLGAELTCSATKLLFRDLKHNYGMNFHLTSKDDSNPLESMFGVVRGMDGANVDPNGLELLWRLSRIVIDLVLSDTNFDYKSLKPVLEGIIQELKEEGNKTDDEEEGMEEG